MKLIGRGAFSTAYYDGNRVYLKSTDPVKEAMAYRWFPESRLFPVVNLSSKEGFDYEMQYYPRQRAVVSLLNCHDKALYRDLRKVHDRVEYGGVSCSIPSTIHKSYTEYYKALEGLQPKYPNEIPDILEALGACTNYGSDVGFEISPRNVAVQEGKLILLDCFFMKSEVIKRWKK